MKTFFKTLRRQDGFTLVELMVVVAIIGLLSAVAIPNFQKYQARSKTAEAKLQLSAIYTAEASFFADYNIYHSCLNYMGYNPAEESNSRYFTTGFAVTGIIDSSAYLSAVNAGINTGSCLEAGTTSEGSTVFTAGKRIGAALADSSFIFQTSTNTQSNSTTMTYLAGAAGIVHKNFTMASSQANGAAYFRIDHNKRIYTIQNGF